MSRLTTALALLLLTAPVAVPRLQAEERAAPPPASAPARAERPVPERSSPERAADRLPADAMTRHEINLPGRTLRYTATAGSLPLTDPKGRVLVEIAYVAYTLDGEAPERRPITFAFNGGPGASSAYLHLGALGPKRLSFGNRGEGPSTPPALVDNAETWLDFTDLVFIDPVGTGFSRFAAEGDDVRRQFWSVDGDARALARVVAKYLARNGRLASPKFLAGESYGGFRGPKVASLLQTGEGVGVSGLILLSPVLDFGVRSEAGNGLLPVAARLPSMAAARLDRDGAFSPDRLAEVERYARGDLLADLARGPRDGEAVRRIVDRVTAFTGLDRALVARLGGRVDAQTFAREFYRGEAKIGSAYDVTVPGADPDPNAARSSPDDPILDGSRAPLTSAAVDYLARTLNWAPEGRYYLLNDEVSQRWNWGRGLRPPEVVSDLKAALALDDRLQVLVTHGYTDLVTPYFETRLVLDQIPAIGTPDRVRLDVFPGGHMFYTRDGSRAALRESVKRLYAASAG